MNPRKERTKLWSDCSLCALGKLCSECNRDMCLEPTDIDIHGDVDRMINEYNLFNEKRLLREKIVAIFEIFFPIDTTIYRDRLIRLRSKTIISIETFLNRLSNDRTLLLELIVILLFTMNLILVTSLMVR
jgi:hypothetical protein